MRIKNWNKITNARTHVVYRHESGRARGVGYRFGERWRYGLLLNGYPIHVGTVDDGRKASCTSELISLLQEKPEALCTCPECGTEVLPRASRTREDWMAVRMSATCPVCSTEFPDVVVHSFLDWHPGDSDTIEEDAVDAWILEESSGETSSEPDDVAD